MSSMRVRAPLLLVGLVARVQPRIACASAASFYKRSDQNGVYFPEEEGKVEAETGDEADEQKAVGI